MLIKLPGGSYINPDSVTRADRQIICADTEVITVYFSDEGQPTTYAGDDLPVVLAALDRLAVPQDDGVVEMANRVECFLERLGHYLHQSDDEPVWEKEYRDLRTYIKARAGGAA